MKIVVLNANECQVSWSILHNKEAHRWKQQTLIKSVSWSWMLIIGKLGLLWSDSSDRASRKTAHRSYKNKFKNKCITCTFEFLSVTMFIQSMQLLLFRNMDYVQKTYIKKASSLYFIIPSVIGLTFIFKSLAEQIPEHLSTSLV